MMFPLLLLLLVFFRQIVAPDPDTSGDSFHTSEAVVLAEGDRIEMKEMRSFHQNRCLVHLQADGNLVVKRLFKHNPGYQTYNVAWHTQSAGAGTYHAQLNDHDGSLEVHRDPGEVVYTSNNGDPEALEGLVSPPARNHVLVINEECILKIRREDVMVWTNNHLFGLGGNPGITNFLQRGEMMHVNVCLPCDVNGDCIYVPHTLLLQFDCNLVQFRGMDQADRPEYPTVFWSSNSRRSDGSDCYLYEDEDTLRLYTGTLDKSLAQFAPRAGTAFWTAEGFQNPCSGGYEVLLDPEGGLVASC